MKNKYYYTMNNEELYKTLKTSENGLTCVEAHKRLKNYGYNELPKKKPDSIFKIFISELLDPIVILLIIAIIIVGRFTGLQLFEYFRFSPILKDGDWGEEEEE